MFVKNLGIAFLLDFYGDVLTERTRDMLEMYYCDDLSLAEISENVGISRQGVRQSIKKGEEELLSLEEKLGLANRHIAIKEAANELIGIAVALETEPAPEESARLATAARLCAEKILAENLE